MGNESQITKFSHPLFKITKLCRRTALNKRSTFFSQAFIQHTALCFLVLFTSVNPPVQAETTEVNGVVYITIPSVEKFRHTHFAIGGAFLESHQAACASSVSPPYVPGSGAIVRENPRATGSCVPGSECDCLYLVTNYASSGTILNQTPDWLGQNWVQSAIFCPTDYYLGRSTQCERSFTKGFYVELNPPEKQCNTPRDGNPCNAATGNKFQTETDYTSSVSNGLHFSRYYNSQGSTKNAEYVAMGWRHTYSRTLGEAPIERRAESQQLNMPNVLASSTTLVDRSSLYSSAQDACIMGWNDLKGTVFGGQFSSATASLQGESCKVSSGGQTVTMMTIRSSHPSSLTNSANSYLDLLEQSNTMTVNRANGSQLFFEKNGGVWTSYTNETIKLEQLTNGWRFTDSNDTIEEYDSDGKLLSITNRAGLVQTLEYTLPSGSNGDDNPNTLDRVTGPFGRELRFTYNAQGYLRSVTTPDGILQYQTSVNGNLSSVTYPDNQERRYVYDKPNQPHKLTGIIDENGDRFATWDYDNKGRAILSKHALDTEAVTFTYNNDGTTTVLDPLGGTHTYTFETVNGSSRVKEVTGDRCLSCPNRQIVDRTYDANGYLSSTTDWKGNQTTYTYNTRGLVEERIEASGTPQQRKTITQWHTSFRVPEVIEVYDTANTLVKKTINSYDSQGRLQTQTVETPNT